MENSFCRGLLTTAKLFKLSQQAILSSDNMENMPVPDPGLLDVNEKPRLGGYNTQYFSETQTGTGNGRIGFLYIMQNFLHYNASGTRTNGLPS